MIRLHILAEGQTEEGFVNGILAPELSKTNIYADAHCITTGRRHGRLFRGGLSRYEQIARDLIIWMKQDQNIDSWFTTMVDFYALPTDFPGRVTLSPALAPLAQVKQLEDELRKDIAERLNGLPVSRRLIPYIQLHEFEALLFSDPAGFLEAYPDSADAVEKLTSIRKQFQSPEDIDNVKLTAPSRRIRDILPEYQKPVAGLLIAQRIGISSIRRECWHFNEWFSQMLALSGPGQAMPTP